MKCNMFSSYNLSKKKYFVRNGEEGVTMLYLERLRAESSEL